MADRSNMVVKAADDDATLCHLAGVGDRCAFSTLVDRHYDHIFKLAWRFCGHVETAEDVAQDVAVKLARAIKTFRAEASFKTWLYRIVYTTAIDHLRKSQRTVNVAPSYLLEQVEGMHDGRPQPTPEDDQHSTDLWNKVRALSPQQRDAVILVYAQDMTHSEAAKVMGCQESTVSWHLHEAKKRLKLELEA